MRMCFKVFRQQQIEELYKLYTRNQLKKNHYTCFVNNVRRLLKRFSSSIYKNIMSNEILSLLYCVI